MVVKHDQPFLHLLVVLLLLFPIQNRHLFTAEIALVCHFDVSQEGENVAISKAYFEDLILDAMNALTHIVLISAPRRSGLFSVRKLLIQISLCILHSIAFLLRRTLDAFFDFAEAPQQFVEHEAEVAVLGVLLGNQRVLRLGVEHLVDASH